MATYIVWHKNRRKKIEIEIHPKDEWKIQRRVPGFLYQVIRTYYRETGYSKFLNYRGLEFSKKEEKHSSLGAIPQEPTFAEPCDKDWCNACRNGDFDKCPNRH